MSTAAVKASSGLLKFLVKNPRNRPQGTDFQSAVLWGVAAATTAIWLIQPFDWARRTFFEKPEHEEK